MFAPLLYHRIPFYCDLKTFSVVSDRPLIDLFHLFQLRHDRQQHGDEAGAASEAEITIARFLEQVSDGHLSDDSKMKVRQMLREIGEIESIGDSCYRLARTTRRNNQQGREFDATMLQHLNEMMALCDKALDQMNTVLGKPLDDQDLRQAYYYENQLNTLRDRIKSDNIKAIDDRQYDYALGTAYGELVGELEKLGDYVINVVEARFGK